jgi:UDP-N-acetyl-D-galactosamine dehydrogenase
MEAVGIIGLGRIGMPLALAFGRHILTIAYDPSLGLVAESKRRKLSPNGDGDRQFAEAVHFEPTTVGRKLLLANVIVAAVPPKGLLQPVPNEILLKDTMHLAGENLRPGGTVVVESLLPKEMIRDICVPVLERWSGMSWKKDFFVAYSPILGDPDPAEHRLSRIAKHVFADTPRTQMMVAQAYGVIFPCIQLADLNRPSGRPNVLHRSNGRGYHSGAGVRSSSPARLHAPTRDGGVHQRRRF